ncbi:MAG TPA: DUF4038 domain-containing protein [Verrucomicrobiae bacterium]|nr:DUF4038 domain-containing protein [Verrucomicrobiae bacterium]
MLRIDSIRVGIYLIGLQITSFSVSAKVVGIEQWGIFEASWHGPTNENPFLDVQFSGQFSWGDTNVEVNGFYDGGGEYRLRFMPQEQGHVHYVTHSNVPELNGQSGDFVVSAPSAQNHGPVRVAHVYHFAYADGTPFRPIGTTCYNLTHMVDSIEDETLASLAAAPFNKVRLCVFPKHQEGNTNELALYPFEGTPPKTWDYTRFDPRFFQHLEKRIGDLRDRGIEADLILFDPYDKGRWGFDRMKADVDDRYVRYMVARLGAYRNVWWSLSNEYDFNKNKTERDWDRLFRIVQEADPYAHLRSIHNGFYIYNNTKPWVTHASIQNGAAVEDNERAMLYRDVYRKPVVFDEVKYEGNIARRWGQLSGEELVFRFWEATIAGTYVTHGETFSSPDHISWTSEGGKLHGQSPARLAFLKQVLAESPAEGLEPIDKWQDSNMGGQLGEYYLLYLGKETPTSWPFELYKDRIKDGMRFKVDVLDTWNMTVTPLDGEFVTKKKDNYHYVDATGRAVPLPGKPYMAVRIRRVPDAKTAPPPADTNPPE